MSTDDPVEVFIRRLATDPAAKSRVRQVLDLENDYARKADLVPILERLEQQGEELKLQREELKLQREDMEKGFVKVWDELKAQRMAMEEGFKNMWEEMKELRKSQDKIHRRMDKHEAFWRKIAGEELELHSLMWFQGVLNAKGFPSDNLRWSAKFDDPQRRLETPEIEIDLFQEEPLMVVEVTSFVDTLDKLMTFIKKIKFIEEKYAKRPKAVFITYRVSKNIEEAFTEIQKSNSIELITIGRKLDFSFLDED